jgi:hypothetical protein
MPSLLGSQANLSDPGEIEDDPESLSDDIIGSEAPAALRKSLLLLGPIEALLGWRSRALTGRVSLCISKNKRAKVRAAIIIGLIFIF